MVCFDSARNGLNTCDCPILKNLGFKIEKRTPSDTPPREAASHVVTETPPSHGSTPYLALAPAPAPPADSHQGSTVVPGMFLAATKTRYDSEDKFDYKGKSEGVVYTVDKSKNTNFAYLPASCSHTTLDPIPTHHSAKKMWVLIPADAIFTTKMGGLNISDKRLLSKPVSTASRTAQDP
jgi:hypothetical protein